MKAKGEILNWLSLVAASHQAGLGVSPNKSCRATRGDAMWSGTSGADIPILKAVEGSENGKLLNEKTSRGSRGSTKSWAQSGDNQDGVEREEEEEEEGREGRIYTTAACVPGNGLTTFGKPPQMTSSQQ